jgi:hypothetical protein
MENTASNSYSIVARVGCLATALVLLLVTQPLTSNGGFSGSQILALGKYATIRIPTHEKLKIIL